MSIFRLCIVVHMLLWALPCGWAQNSLKVDSLQKALKKNISQKERVNTYNLIAYQYRSADSTLVAYYTNEAIQLAEKIPYPEGIADAYYHLGWISMQKGHYEAAAQLYKQGLKIARTNNYYKGIGDAYNGLGGVYFYQGNYAQTLQWFQKSLDAKTKVGDKKGMAATYNNMGEIYRRKGKYPKALEFLGKSYEMNSQIGEKRGMALALNNTGEVHQQQGNYPTALEFFQRSLRISLQTENQRIMALNYNNIGLIYRSRGNDSKALEFFEKALRINTHTGDKRAIAGNYNNKGLIFQYEGKYDKALHFFEKALKVNRQIGHQSGVANGFLYLGRLALKQQQPEKAQKYFEKALALQQQIGQQGRSAEVWIDLGVGHYIAQEYAQAEACLTKGVALATQLGNPRIVKDGAEYLAKTYEATQKPWLAYKNLVLFKKMTDSLFNSDNIKKMAQLEYKHTLEKRADSLQMAQAQKQKLAQAAQEKTQMFYNFTFGGLLATLIIGFLVFYYNKQRSNNQKLSEANQAVKQQQEELQTQHNYLEQAYQSIQLLTDIGQEITASLDLDEVLTAIYRHINELMDVTNFGIGLYEPHNDRIIFKLTIVHGKRNQRYPVNTTNKNQLVVWCVENSQPIKMGNVLQEYQKYIADIDTEKDRLQNYLMVELPQSVMYIPLIIQQKTIGVIAVHSYNKNAYSDYHLDLLKNLSLYVAIAVDNAQVYQQLDRKNHDIMESIRYAQRIQQATLPLDSVMQKYLPEHFVLFRPCNVVSGDFYWCEKDRNRVFLVAADCTGHGVPGAFMTMLGVQALSHIIVQSKIHTPDLILFCLDGILRQILKSENTMLREGMDMSLCVIDQEKQILYFAGAKNPLIVVQNGEINEIKGDVYSINGHRQDNDGIEFTTHAIDISVPTTFYMYSDGFQSQFGGEEGKKFMKKRFRELLLETSAYAMPEQKRVLNRALNEWMQVSAPGGPGNHEQIDDILVIGVRADVEA
ncbi:tetratricopeptide repeat protein [Microscilla marina]|nr:tetratricopeptide repeat protein [Microscilla marina]